MTFSVKTRKLFAGRIFVKGKTAEQSCTRSDFAKQQTTTPAFDLTFGACGMRGQRAEEPRGMFYSVTLVVSFHPMFVTKVDRAYHVKCFFEEALRTITAGIDVSMITTADITAFRSSTGVCTYTIHQGSVSTGSGNIGPAISVAQVGDKIVHKWECTDAMYGILVRSCFVTDGFGTQAEVIDRRGCPVDPVLISAISYDASLTQAFAESHVFKFADRPGVWFHCELQMCLKMSQACDGLTPPSCGMMPPGIGGTSETMPWYNRTTATGEQGTRPTGRTATPIPGGETPQPGTNPGLPISGSTATAVIPNSTPPVEGETEAGTTPGFSPPPGFTSGTPTGAGIGTATTELPPAPGWSSTPNGTAAHGGTTSGITGSTPETVSRVSSVPSGYIQPESTGDRKRLLQRQKVEDGDVEVSTAAAYEEEELIYDGSEYDEETDAPTTSSTSSKKNVTNIPQKKSKRPSSSERTATSRSHRRSTATVTRTVIKRHSNSVVEIDPNDVEQRTTKRFQEITRRLRKPIPGQRRKQQPRLKRPSKLRDDADEESDDTFMYRDNELSNRLIIFDVDEEPPPGYLHWAKSKPVFDQQEDATVTRPSNEKNSGILSRIQSTTSASDACVVSAQGLIMILMASSSISVVLMIVLAIVCVRYRMDIAAKNRQFVLQQPTTDLDDATKRSTESGDAVRRVNDRNTRWQHQQQQKISISSNSDVELSRLSRPPHERRKHR